MQEIFGEKIHEVPIEEELKKSYLDYAMSVIIGRALPDIRDGLKPVHRRILYAMHELGNVYNKPYKKSARIVGEVIGKYHPHGDAAVYDAIVRMAQDFSLRYPLIDGQGNFGSVDGDPPAAMRYTEVRMTKIASEFLVDIDKETVDFMPNYDSSLEEPVILPTKVPNLLINGSSGIAVGMATNIPPHNLTEVIDALIAIIDNPDISIDELIKIIPGPDFPTYGIIKGKKGIEDAYKTGKGSIVISGKAEIEELKGKKPAIVITEIPYQVNKAKLIEKIALLVKEKKIDGITDVRDESDRRGMRIVVELRKDAQPNVILNNLYKHTALQTSFGIILLGVLNNQPKVFNLKELLSYFIDFRKEIVTRRTIFEKRKAEEKAHILEGLKKAIENIDEVISIIRSSENPQIAKERLIERFGFSDKQAQAILDMRLQRLTSLERDKIVTDYEETLKLISKLTEILEKEEKLMEVIKEELIYIKKTYGDERRTKIEAASVEFDVEDYIPDEEMIVTITKHGYIKRTPLKVYRSQKRGGKGRSGITTKEEDVVKDIFVASTKDNLLLFTNRGKVYSIKVYELPQPVNVNAKGRAVVNLVNLEYGEKILSILPVKNFQENKYITMATVNGIVKKTDLKAFSNIRSNGIIAIILDENDQLLSAKLTDGNNEIFLGTYKGKSIRFSENDVRSTGRNSRGVIGIRLEKEDKVITMEVLDREGEILTVTEKGFGKRTPVSEYTLQSRGGKGIKLANITEKSGPIVEALQVKEDDEIILSTNKGKFIRISVNEIRVCGRVTTGVKLVNLDNADEKVVSVTRIAKNGNEED